MDKLAQENMNNEETLIDLAELFKIFGDSTRIRILFSLFDSDRHVADIADTLGMSQSAISHQLRILKTSKLVTSKKNGKQVIYSLADDHVKSIIAQGLEHVLE